jgi:hypothetical protein
VHGGAQNSDVLFYLNPANKGAVTGRKEIEYHLNRNNYTPIESYIEPKSDVLFVQRLLESLQESYKSVGFTEKEEKIKHLLELFKGHKY